MSRDLSLRPRAQLRRFKLTPLSAAVLALFLPAGVHAQSAADPKLPEVNVTAPAPTPAQGNKTDVLQSPKFTAPVLDTPKSIVVIPQQVIQQTASSTLQEALRTTPGITFAAGEGGTPNGDRPVIRGFDATSDTYVDGIRSTGSQSRETFAIDSVEILKGPSSAFSGRGSAGGSINLVTKQAQKDDFLRGTVAVGTDNYARATVDVNTMLGTDSAFRLAAMGHTFDQPGRDDVDGQRWGIAPSLTFGLNSPTRVKVNYYHLQSNDMPDYGLPYYNSGTLRSKDHPDTVVSNVSRDNFYGLKDRDFRTQSADIGTVAFEHDFSDNFTIRNATRYDRSTNDYIVTNPDDSSGNVPRGQVYRSYKSRNSSTEVVTNQTDGTLKFNVAGFKNTVNTGIEISREDTTNRPWVVSNIGQRDCRIEPVTSFNCTSLYDPDAGDDWAGRIRQGDNPTNTVTNTRGVYAFDTVEITPQWLFNGGLRYDNYRIQAHTPAFTNPTTNAAVAAVNLQNNSSFWNWQAGAVYKPTLDSSVYLAYGTSSQPSGASNGDGNDNLAATIQNLKPERLRNLELGTKWDVLDGSLQLTAAVFHTQKTNARVQVDTTTFQTIGKQQIDGFEVGASGAITDQWQVFAGYTYLDSEIKDAGNFGTNALNEGNRFPQTPKQSVSLWSTYDLGHGFTVGGGAYGMARVYGNPANSLYVPGYWRFDAMASYRVNRNVTVQLNVQNLGDRRYFDRAFTTHMATVAAGRSAVLSASLAY
ncbi:TonB-dependent siderophore receptor PiuA [soil metagenome]